MRLPRVGGARGLAVPRRPTSGATLDYGPWQILIVRRQLSRSLWKIVGWGWCSVWPLTTTCCGRRWQFDGRGACTHIPQLRNDEKAQQVACASRRSCVRAYPTQVAHGLLWVLPDSSAAGWEKVRPAC